MVSAIVTVVLTFALSTFIGNWLLQRWQQRNWFHQQSLLGEQKHYESLRDLCDEILAYSNTRISKMRRLLGVLQQADLDLIKARLADYDRAVTDWNERFGVFVVKLRFYARYDMATRLGQKCAISFCKIRNLFGAINAHPTCRRDCKSS